MEEQKDIASFIQENIDSFHIKSPDPGDPNRPTDFTQKVDQEYSMVGDIENSRSIIQLFNNNKGDLSESKYDQQSLMYVTSKKDYLRNIVINAKFKLDKKIQHHVKLKENKVFAQMMGQSYCNQEAFLKDFESYLWITYRKNFAPLLIENKDVKSMSSDAGWGCVIRCSQMQIANVFRQMMILQR